jgi:hypothetical protein
VAFLAHISAGGVVQEFSVPGIDFISSITGGSDGNRWFEAYPINREVPILLRMARDGSFAAFSVVGPYGGVQALTTASDGIPWFVELETPPFSSPPPAPGQSAEALIDTIKP